MSARFETLGNASVLLFQDGKPVLATDPWLTGTCYFGSWALDHPLSPEQIRNFVDAGWIWISHGHPDHLHDESLNMLPAGKRFLLPNHYDTDIATNLRERGFTVSSAAKTPDALALQKCVGKDGKFLPQVDAPLNAWLNAEEPNSLKDRPNCACACSPIATDSARSICL